MNTNAFLRLAAIAGLIALSGCDTMTETLGLNRESPDEFTVTTRAPLSMPPDYTLRPPQPGAPRPQETSERQQAEAALAPDSVLNNAAPADISPGQQALLTSTGPAAPRNIRNQVDSEASLDRPSQSLTDHLMFWKDAPAVGTPINAAAESRRLQQNAALGQSPTTGEAPIIQQRQPGWLDSIF